MPSLQRLYAEPMQHEEKLQPWHLKETLPIHRLQSVHVVVSSALIADSLSLMTLCLWDTGATGEWVYVRTAAVCAFGSVNPPVIAMRGERSSPVTCPWHETGFYPPWLWALSTRAVCNLRFNINIIGDEVKKHHPLCVRVYRMYCGLITLMIYGGL
jgi:hypothetical protein